MSKKAYSFFSEGSDFVDLFPKKKKIRKMTSKIILPKFNKFNQFQGKENSISKSMPKSFNLNSFRIINQIKPKSILSNYLLKKRIGKGIRRIFDKY